MSKNRINTLNEDATDERGGAQSAEQGGGAPPVRVILVGRTGLDATLRLDPEIELIRARTPLAAIGELADPIEPGDSLAGGTATVIVSHDAVPPERAGTFVAALRKVDRDVRVLAVGNSLPMGAGFDGVVPPDSTPQAVRRLAKARPPRSLTTPAETVEVREDPEPPMRTNTATQPEAPLNEDGAHEMPPVHQTAAHAPPHAASANNGLPPPPPPQGSDLSDDESMFLRNGAAMFGDEHHGLPTVAEGKDGAADEVTHAGASPALSLLAGKDPVPAVLAQIRERLGDPSANLVTADSPPPNATLVSHSGRRLGWLVSRSHDRAALTDAAAELGLWRAVAMQQEHLRRAAFTDELTGAYNRRYFTRFLAAALDQARIVRHGVTILFFDIDNFKRYNDQFGHVAGDEILVESVRLLASVIRPSDRVCRIGGDEFAVIFHDPKGPRDAAVGAPRDVSDIAKRFQKQVCEHRFPKLGASAPGTLTISGGLATFPWDGRTVQELLDHADALALRSKQQGKNAIILGPDADQVCRATTEPPAADAGRPSVA